MNRLSQGLKLRQAGKPVEGGDFDARHRLVLPRCAALAIVARAQEDVLFGGDADRPGNTRGRYGPADTFAAQREGQGSNALHRGLGLSLPRCAAACCEPSVEKRIEPVLNGEVVLEAPGELRLPVLRTRLAQL